MVKMPWIPDNRVSDFKTIWLGAGSILCTILSFGLLPLWVGKGDMLVIFGLAPLALSQSLFEAGLVYRIADSLQHFWPRQNFRIMVALPFLVLSVALYLGNGKIAFGYLVSIILKAILSMVFMGLACQKKAFNYERFGRFLAALITLAATLVLGAISRLNYWNLKGIVPLWINIQILICVPLLGVLLWMTWREQQRLPFGLSGVTGIQVIEDAWLFFVSLAGLLMYSWWPLYFSIRPGSSLFNSYSQLGFFYLCYSLVGPLVLKKALFEFQISDRLFNSLIRLLRGINLGLLVASLLFNFAFSQGRVSQIGSVVLAGLCVMVNEGFATLLFPTCIVGHRHRVIRYTCVLFVAVLSAAIMCELTHQNFPLYVVLLTNMIGWMAFPILRSSAPAESAV